MTPSDADRRAAIERLAVVIDAIQTLPVDALVAAVGHGELNYGILVTVLTARVKLDVQVPHPAGTVVPGCRVFDEARASASPLDLDGAEWRTRFAAVLGRLLNGRPPQAAAGAA